MEEKLQIRNRIEEEIAATLVMIEKYRELAQPIAPENAIGRISRMDAINNRSVNESALKKAELKFNNLKVALTRIDDSDFGLCVRCKNPIPIGRILLLPQVITCVHCAR